jgi:hypothetical protein
MLTLSLPTPDPAAGRLLGSTRGAARAAAVEPSTIPVKPPTLRDPSGTKRAGFDCFSNAGTGGVSSISVSTSRPGDTSSATSVTPALAQFADLPFHRIELFCGSP